MSKKKFVALSSAVMILCGVVIFMAFDAIRASASQPVTPEKPSHREYIPEPQIEINPLTYLDWRDPVYWPKGYFPGDPVPNKTIYLTFDDGPSDFTGQILDVLKEENVRATFFLNSFDRADPNHGDPRVNYLLKYPKEMRRLVAEGHVIGNHTYSHMDLASLTPRRIAFQLTVFERHLKEALGKDAPALCLIRPPFGSPWSGNWNKPSERATARSALQGRGYVMLWTRGWDSSDSLEWAPGEWFETASPRYHPGGPKYVEKMRREANRILARADGRAGGIILMHDTHPTSADILRSLIRELKRRGYSFATLNEYCVWRWGPDALSRFK